MTEVPADATVLMLSNRKTSGNVVHLPDDEGAALCGRQPRPSGDGRRRNAPFEKTRRQVPWHDICEDCATIKREGRLVRDV
jgi:hypothetical protein